MSFVYIRIHSATNRQISLSVIAGSGRIFRSCMIGHCNPNLFCDQSEDAISFPSNTVWENPVVSLLILNIAEWLRAIIDYALIIATIGNIFFTFLSPVSRKGNRSTHRLYQLTAVLVWSTHRHQLASVRRVTFSASHRQCQNIDFVKHVSPESTEPLWTYLDVITISLHTIF